MMVRDRLHSWYCLVSEQTLGKIEKRVWEIGWGGSVHCARNAGALPIDS